MSDFRRALRERLELKDFKIGQHVRVKSFEDIKHAHCKTRFNNTKMRKYCGVVFVVVGIDDYGRYKLDNVMEVWENPSEKRMSDWIWDKKWLEPAPMVKQVLLDEDLFTI